MRKIILAAIGILILVLIGAFALVSAQDQTPSTSDTGTAPERDSVAVTIYNQGTALVQDRRTFNFQAGTNLINFTDVAASIDPTSVNFTSITDPTGTSVLEQNYVYDLVGSSALLARYVDQTIRVTTADGTVYEGQLLNGSNEIILKTSDGAVVVVKPDNIRDIRFPDLPSGLITRPTLRWLIDSQKSGDQQVELTYLTGGINWAADYNVLLSHDNSSLDLNGWVTLNNNSGTAYQDAQVKLIAGDVNRIQPQPTAVRGQELAVAQTALADTGVAQRNFSEYQLYEIGRHVTIGNNETKQVEFVNGTGVPATTFFVYDSSPQFYGYSGINTDQFYGATDMTDVQNFLEFTTAEENGLGADLPAGNIRVYQEDVDGSALLIGENTIDHTPKGEKVQIYLGNAFDLVGERTQTNFQMIGSSVVEESFEIKLRNHKDSGTVQIRVPERLTRAANWEITNSSQPYEKLDSDSIEFRVDVPAGQEVSLTYTVRYTSPR